MNKLFAFIFMFFTVNAAYAEPSRTVNFLMGDPLTMWDFGMYRLSERLDGLILPSSRHKFFATASYTPDTNRIVIYGSPPLDFKSKPIGRVQSATTGEAKALCKEMVEVIRAILGVSLETGEPIVPFSKNSSICGHFSHENFKSTNEPKNMCGELDSMTIVQAYTETKSGYVVRCNGPLVSNRVFFSE